MCEASQEDVACWLPLLDKVVRLRGYLASVLQDMLGLVTRSAERT